MAAGIIAQRDIFTVCCGLQKICFKEALVFEQIFCKALQTLVKNPYCFANNTGHHLNSDIDLGTPFLTASRFG